MSAAHSAALKELEIDGEASPGAERKRSVLADPAAGESVEGKENEENEEDEVGQGSAFVHHPSSTTSLVAYLSSSSDLPLSPHHY